MQKLNRVEVQEVNGAGSASPDYIDYYQDPEFV